MNILDIYTHYINVCFMKQSQQIDMLLILIEFAIGCINFHKMYIFQISV